MFLFDKNLLIKMWTRFVQKYKPDFLIKGKKECGLNPHSLDYISEIKLIKTDAYAYAMFEVLPQSLWSLHHLFVHYVIHLNSSRM